MRFMIVGAVFAATLSAAHAEGACTTIADNTQAIKQKAGASQDTVFTGLDAKDFLQAMTRLLGPMPTAPRDLAAVSAHLYAGSDGQKVASVHFYSGTDRCDAGIDAAIAPVILDMIVGKVGVRI